MTMTAEFNAGGCERCGKQDHVTYSHWQFLCGECREVLADEQHREHDRALLRAVIEAGGVRAAGGSRPAGMGMEAPG